MRAQLAKKVDMKTLNPKSFVFKTSRSELSAPIVIRSLTNNSWVAPCPHYLSLTIHLIIDRFQAFGRLSIFGGTDPARVFKNQFSKWISARSAYAGETCIVRATASYVLGFLREIRDQSINCLTVTTIRQLPAILPCPAKHIHA